MIVSTAIVVLPVWRSPMISSRWPRPIGISASMALMPVWSGSFTGWRWTTPGALNSTGRNWSVSIGPRSSSGMPSGSTTRPSRASPTGTWMTFPVRRTVVALLDEGVVAQQHHADVVLLEVQREAGDVVGELEHLEGHARLEAVDAGDAVTHLEDAADLLDLHGARVVLDLAPEDLGDLVGSQLHLGGVTFLCSGRAVGALDGQDDATAAASTGAACRVSAQLVEAAAEGAVHDDARRCAAPGRRRCRGPPTR